MKNFRFCTIAAACLLLLPPIAAAAGPETIGPAPRYAAAARELERIIEREMRDKGLPAVSIALIDDQEIVWARGFGMADPVKKVPANAETVYRVGSVSKLFTDLAILQLVERGRIDLDAPVTRYLPEFKPADPFGKTITLRHLMAHRSGLTREPPIGNYFDPSEPGLAETIASLNSTSIILEPGSAIKYSNAAIAVVGRVVEKTLEKPFARCIDENVLGPLRLESSSFEARPELLRRLAGASMWTYDGRIFPAPVFQFGMAPAGNLYSTVTDLGRFTSVLFNGGKGPGGELVKPATLQAMWALQFARPGDKSGFGIGFSISELDGKKLVGHGGAVYGFATDLSALPEEKLGAVAVATLDVANNVVRRFNQHALRMMLALRDGKPAPVFPAPALLDAGLARRIEGRYLAKNGSGEAAEIFRRGERTLLRGREEIVELRSLDGALVMDDRLAFGGKISAQGDELRIGGSIYARQAPAAPAPAPERWRGLIGEYGWDHDILYILERDGKLSALIEWFTEYPLEEISADVFKFPSYGLYPGEKLIFSREGGGAASQVETGSVVFKRRLAGGEGGKTFRIRPLKPAAELKKAALASSPPDETGDFLKPDLVDLRAVDTSIRFDIRYAGENNFMGTRFYDEPRAFLQRPAAEALRRAQESLRGQGYGLLIHDGYRPWHITKVFWEATPPEQRQFVADPAKGSRHNRGCAVDLTLCDLKTGEPIEMVSGYDEFSTRAYPDYPGETSLQRWHREVLRRAMEEQGFQVYDNEWWHFDFKDWRRYPILNLTFDRIGK